MESAAEYTVQGSDEQGTDAWRYARAGFCTASNFAKVMTEPDAAGKKAGRTIGKTAEKYLDQVLTEYLTGRPAPEIHIAAFEYGHRWEQEAREVFEDRTGLNVDVVGFIQHQELPRVGCSPDGLIGDTEGLELKCPINWENHTHNLRTKEVPPEYMAQIQGAMWVTKRDRWYFASYCPFIQEPDLRMVIVPVERDEKFIARLETAVTRFVRVLLESIHELGGRS